jgi:hypothetical protein
MSSILLSGERNAEVNIRTDFTPLWLGHLTKLTRGLRKQWGRNQKLEWQRGNEGEEGAGDSAGTWSKLWPHDVNCMAVLLAPSNRAASLSAKY